MPDFQIEHYFSHASTEFIAKDLLGRTMIFHSQRGLMKFLITETEAYIGRQDLTAHASWQKQSARNAPLWGAPGLIYVYQLRAQYLLNFVTQAVNEPQGILIRGIEPLEGQALMQANRPVPLKNLTNGPGKLTQALGMKLELNGQALNEGVLNLDLTHRRKPIEIAKTARIGVPNKGRWSSAPLRFIVVGNPFVSAVKQSAINTKTHGWQSATESEEQL